MNFHQVVIWTSPNTAAIRCRELFCVHKTHGFCVREEHTWDIDPSKSHPVVWKDHSHISCWCLSCPWCRWSKLLVERDAGVVCILKGWQQHSSLKICLTSAAPWQRALRQLQLQASFLCTNRYAHQVIILCLKSFVSILKSKI